MENGIAAWLALPKERRTQPIIDLNLGSRKTRYPKAQRAAMAALKELEKLQQLVQQLAGLKQNLPRNGSLEKLIDELAKMTGGTSQ